MIRSSSTFDLSLKILNHNSERFSSSIRSSKMALQTDLALHQHFPYHQQNNCDASDISTSHCFQEHRTPRTMHIMFNKCNDTSSALSLVSSSSTSSSNEMPSSVIVSSLIDGPATRALRRTIQEQQERQRLMKRYMNRTYDIDNNDNNSSSSCICDDAFPITKRHRPNFGSEVRCPSNPQSSSSSTSSQPILHNWTTVYESLVNASAPMSTDSRCCNEPFPKIDYSIFDE